MKGERYSEKESAAETMREGAVQKSGAKRKNKTAGAGEIVFRVLCFILSFCLLALSGVEAATQFSDSAWEQWTPDYEKADLTDVLEKGAGNLTEEDYSLIYAQTGLTKIGTDRLLEKGDRNKIARIQESYFKKREVVRERFAPWTCWEKIEDDYAVIGEVRAGDIIVTSATHVLGFRYGHAALIVADDGTLIEANTPDSKSHRTWVSVFNDYASFMILRPDPERISDETRLNIAAYANEELTGIPYTVFAGIFRKKYQQPLKGTQCAHIVWYAYRRFGIDLDSDGGCIVKPQDMANSPYMQVVQIYGFDPEKLWK